MLVRIVKLTFKKEYIDDFKTIFKNSKNKIRGFEGCNHLELLQNSNNPAVFMTYSFWDKKESLEDYRNSDLFKTVWQETKVLFDAKPEAWSMNQLEKLD